jgi:hypothetical protein
MGDLATVRVLGWDGDDTNLRLDHVHQELTTKLRWPDHCEEVDQWRKNWSSAFTQRHREVITSKDLAVRFADLAAAIRRKVNAALAVETESGRLRKLMKAFQESLIHDLKEDDFADMYVQTIAARRRWNWLWIKPAERTSRRGGYRAGQRSEFGPARLAKVAVCKPWTTSSGHCSGCTNDRRTVFWEVVRHQARLVYDMDDTRKDAFGVYYTLTKPLTLEARAKK